jgi:hypothetical protein
MPDRLIVIAQVRQIVLDVIRRVTWSREINLSTLVDDIGLSVVRLHELYEIVRKALGADDKLPAFSRTRLL